MSLLEIFPYLVGLSGWASFAYNYLTSKPRIQGRILSHMSGEREHPSKAGEKITAFFIYLYLVNHRRNAIHIVDYELELDRGKGYEKMMRFYGLEKMKNWLFTGDGVINHVPDFPSQVITAEAKPIALGNPLRGFVVFASEDAHSTFMENVRKYRVTCIDAFGGKYRIETSPEKLPPINLIRELVDMEIVPINSIRGQEIINKYQDVASRARDTRRV